MEVFSLVGPSGTGKSYRALLVAKDRDIDYIVDDGLLIKGNKVIAGTSAKREATKLAAVRRAMFLDPSHRIRVAQTIQEYSPAKILILGTSDNMIDKIRKALQLPPVKERININDVASEGEINIARKYRHNEGKHVIPVPTFEIRKDFSGYFLDTLKVFRKKKDNSLVFTEKSIVRPTYSYFGRYTIHQKAIIQMVNFAADSIEGIYRIARVDISSHPEGIGMDVDMVLVYGYDISAVVRKFQNTIKSEIEFMTSLNMLFINVNVKNLIII